MKSPPNFSAVESLLRERIGYGAYSGGTVSAGINRRMQTNGIEDESSYLALLFSNDRELEELIEEVVVPETWFFRDYEPFEYLKEFVSERMNAFTHQTPLRVLSIPASTGEEPYSIAITLVEAGLMPDRFRIDAVDISRRALRKSTEALYSAHSFRENNLNLRRKYFDEAGSMFLLHPEMRATVRFSRGNVLQESTLGQYGSYDVVFFRNLLIYLDENNRKTAIQNVEQVLKKGGLLVLGYAEPQQFFFPGFIPVDHPRSYSSIKPLDIAEESPLLSLEGAGRSPLSSIREKEHPDIPLDRAAARSSLPSMGAAAQSPLPSIREKEHSDIPFDRAVARSPLPSVGGAGGGGRQKRIDTPTQPPPSKGEEQSGAPQMPQAPLIRQDLLIHQEPLMPQAPVMPRTSLKSQAPLRTGAPFLKPEVLLQPGTLPGSEASSEPGEAHGAVLDRARELADTGMFSAAEELACECLKSDAACVDAHYLLAMTALARGDEDNAAAHLNRVIYLDPNHYDALLHLSLLMDRFGRKDQAARYRTRIARLGKEAAHGS